MANDISISAELFLHIPPPPDLKSGGDLAVRWYLDCDGLGGRVQCPAWDGAGRPHNTGQTDHHTPHGALMSTTTTDVERTSKCCWCPLWASECGGGRASLVTVMVRRCEDGDEAVGRSGVWTLSRWTHANLTTTNNTSSHQQQSTTTTTTTIKSHFADENKSFNREKSHNCKLLDN